MGNGNNIFFESKEESTATEERDVENIIVKMFTIAK